MCAPADTRPAIAAIKAGDVASLDAWLATGADPDAHDAEGWTPLLWAAARGRADMVSRLLAAGAAVAVSHARSGALPIHMAGHSGDVSTAATILDLAPEEIDAVWDLNGHTILLQAVFYGHRPLAKMLVERGADTAITTARGLGAVEFARQFQDSGMEAILLPHDSLAEAKAAYYARYLKRIAPHTPPGEAAAQTLADRLVDTIQRGLSAAATDPDAAETTMAAVRDLVETQGAEVNRLGGPLGQPPLIVAVTGNNGLPPVEAVARLRRSVAFYLLERGADPTLHENHPMGAQTVIRASVFNHLDILRACADHLDAKRLADAINEIPVVNGLTALHDTVLRATMAAPDHFEGYLAQAKWLIDHGGRSDIEDFAGVTQAEIARHCNKPDVRRRLLAILAPVATARDPSPAFAD